METWFARYAGLNGLTFETKYKYPRTQQAKQPMTDVIFGHFYDAGPEKFPLASHGIEAMRFMSTAYDNLHANRTRRFVTMFRDPLDHCFSSFLWFLQPHEYRSHDVIFEKDWSDFNSWCKQFPGGNCYANQWRIALGNVNFSRDLVRNNLALRGCESLNVTRLLQEIYDVTPGIVEDMTSSLLVWARDLGSTVSKIPYLSTRSNHSYATTWKNMYSRHISQTKIAIKDTNALDWCLYEAAKALLKKRIKYLGINQSAYDCFENTMASWEAQQAPRAGNSSRGMHFWTKSPLFANCRDGGECALPDRKSIEKSQCQS